MLPSLLPLPASFFKVLPLPQKFNRFRFHIPEQKTQEIKKAEIIRLSEFV